MPTLDPAAQIRQLEATIEELRRREQFLLAVYAASEGLGEASDIVQTLTRMLAERLTVDRCLYASIRDGHAFEVIGDWARGLPSSVGRWELSGFGAARLSAMLDNVPFVLEDATTDPRLTPEDRAAYRAANVASAITVPVHRGGSFVATMAVHHIAPRTWTPGDIELVSMVAARCWETLERAAVARERRAAEQSLLESHARLDYATRLSGIGFWYCDLPFSELRWDERVKAHFWLPADTRVTIELFYERMHPDDREPTRLAIDASIADHSTYDVVYRTVDPATGAIRHIRAMGGTSYDALGSPIRFDGVTLDVTELREAERRKDEFLAILAHELRNPLAPVRTGIELLQDGADRAAIERIATMMQRQVEHVVRIVDDLLDVSRVTLGKLVLVKARTDLRAPIESALETTRGVFAEHAVQLVLDVPAEPVWLSADPSRLAQVFANLFSNAAKFSRRDGTVRIAVKVDAPFRVRIRVSDDGVGIPADRLDSIFVMFTQLDVDPGRSRGGLGIGLALAKRLVEMHGGRILAASDGEGRGATFTVELPLAPEATTAPVETSPDRATRSSLRVLVVDDNVDAGEMLAMLLEASGHRVECAINGRDGIALALASQPDVVLLDLGLPDMEGYEVARQIRASDPGARPYIAAVTGWGDEVHRQRTKEAGFDEHFVKPIDRQRLATALARVAANAR